MLIVTETGKGLLETRQVVPLAVIKDEQKQQLRLTPAVEETCLLMQQLKSVDNVALRRGVAVETVYDYLSTGIEVGVISVDDVVSKELQEKIKSAAANGTFRLKRIKERLPIGVSYGEIKCVVADLKKGSLLKSL